MLLEGRRLTREAHTPIQLVRMVLAKDGDIRMKDQAMYVAD